MNDPLLAPSTSHRWRRRSHVQNSPAPVEITFQAMMHRKMLRKIWGTYESDKPWVMLWVFLTLLLMLGVAGANFKGGNISIKLNTGQIGFWSLVTVVIFSILVYTLTKVIVVVRWMLYWLLLAEVINLLINKDYNLFGEHASLGLLVSLAVLEVCTFAIYVFINYLYPKILASDWFRNTVGARQWWEVRSIGPWTLTYASGIAKSHRSTCTYRGQTSAAGLPHGYGHWMDDSYHGEILTGWWENGRPIGPFRSREFGSGFAFDNVMIAYVIATDDAPKSFKYFPTCNRPPRCGVASVECSVSGAFFAHLPMARLSFGPCLLKTQRYEGSPDTVSRDMDAASVADCLDKLRHLSYAHPLTNLVVTANEERGLTVAGHVYTGSGKSSSKQCTQLVIDVVHSDKHADTDVFSAESLDDAAASTPNFRSSLKFAEYDTVTKDDDEFCLHDDDHIESDDATSFNFDGMASRYTATRSSDSLASSSEKLLLHRNGSSHALNGIIDETIGKSAPHLKVRDWRSTIDGHAEALIFIPGFNASLEHSLERLGQFLVMGHFPPHIKPFIFNWPAGRVATYLWAVESAADAKTVRVFEDLLQGLSDAGIRDVHFLSHSMGVQCLMAAFANNLDGSRSSFSERFILAPDYTTESSDNANLLRARSITLLNPDYPLAAFVQQGFASIRMVCNHITVVGNREDVALYWSEIGNGIMITWYNYVTGRSKYPPHLTVFHPGDSEPEFSHPRDVDSCCPGCATCSRNSYPEENNQGVDRMLSKQQTLGKQIFSLFAPPAVRDHPSSLFTGAPNAILSRMRRDNIRRSTRRQVQIRPWLDIDAIDTTWMETNVHALRHSYFNLNPVLVEDLSELIVTGRRASERATLLHREGNIYSYCQAPACVVNEG